jgi:hypothetical protein
MVSVWWWVAVQNDVAVLLLLAWAWAGGLAPRPVIERFLAFLISSHQRYLHNVSTSFNALFTLRPTLFFWPHHHI